MKDKERMYLGIGLAVIIIGVIYFLASFAVPRVMVTLTKAAVGKKVSINNSRIIGEKILAKADGTDKCVIDVYAMDVSDKGVPGKVIILEGMDGIVPESGISDANGKARFELRSREEKQYEIKAVIEGSELRTMLKVTFRN